MNKTPRHARITNTYFRLLVGLVDHSRRKALWVVLVAACSTIALLGFTLTHLSLDTDTLNLLDKDLPFKQHQQEFDRTFPQLADLIVVVIDGDSASLAEEAASDLVELIRGNDRLFQHVFQPGDNPFFRRQGLLYLNVDELWALEARLTEWEPFLGSLAHDPSLRGLFSILGSALQSPSHAGSRALLARAFEWINETVEAQLTGRPTPHFWRKAMLDGSGLGTDQRRFILVKPYLDYSNLVAAEGPLGKLRHLAAMIESRYPVKVRLTGSVPIEEEERGTISQGAGAAAALSFLLVCLILFAGLRSPRLVGSILATLFVGLVWTAAFATVGVGALNLISATAPVLFIGLGVDFGIQFGMRYRERRERGSDHESALREAASGAGGALTLAAMAAVVSFMAFLPTDYRGLAELGLIAAAGMVIALIGNLTLLPALLTLFPLHATETVPPKRAISRLNFSATSHGRAILWTVIPVASAAVFLMPQVRFDFNPLHLKNPSTEAVLTFQELLRDPETTPYRIEVLAENLASARQLAERLKKLKEVEQTITLASYIPAQQEEKLAIIDQMALVLQPIFMPLSSVAPPTPMERLRAFQTFEHQLAQAEQNNSASKGLREAVRDLLHQLTRLKTNAGWPNGTLIELEQRLIGELPNALQRLQHLLMAKHVDLEDLPQDLQSQYLAQDGRARLEVVPAQDVSDNESLRRFVQAVQAIAPQATGTPVSLLEGGETVVKACLQATGVAVLGTTLLVFIILRSFRETLLVLLPLVVTLVLTLSASVLLEVPLNLANIIALPLLLGLGIAFGIYLVLRKRQGIEIDRLFHSSTSHGVLYSALTTMASFGTLAFADHQGMSSMGLLLTLTLALTLVCTLVLLPAVMGVLDRRKSRAVRLSSTSQKAGLQGGSDPV